MDLVFLQYSSIQLGLEVARMKECWGVDLHHSTQYNRGRHCFQVITLNRLRIVVCLVWLIAAAYSSPKLIIYGVIRQVFRSVIEVSHKQTSAYRVCQLNPEKFANYRRTTKLHSLSWCLVSLCLPESVDCTRRNHNDGSACSRRGIWAKSGSNRIASCRKECCQNYFFLQLSENHCAWHC